MEQGFCDCVARSSQLYRFANCMIVLRILDNNHTISEVRAKQSNIFRLLINPSMVNPHPSKKANSRNR